MIREISMNILRMNACKRTCTKLNLLSTLFFMVSLSLQAGEITPLMPLDVAIAQAQKNDPWLVENKFTQDALESQSIAAGTLPDPTVSLGLLNIPTDSFDFKQEGMTQLNVGISQMFPRGNTLQLQKTKLQLLSRQNPYLREDRKAKMSVLVAGLWFDAFKASESIHLIEKDRNLFEQLVDISEASYSTAFGGTQQQDVIRAQLELTRLEDRLTKLKQQQEVAQNKLTQWVSGQFVTEYSNTTTPVNTTWVEDDSHALPQLVLRQANLMQLADTEFTEQLTHSLVKHPLLMALDSRINASNTDIELAKQKYKSQWGVNAGYGYRANDMTGNDRADLFSLGVNFDLPLFTTNKQDKEVQAAVFDSEAIKTQKWLLLREMIAAFNTSRVELQRLDQRYQLYQEKLLPQIHEQAESALTAYTNDAGDFAEVVRARIDVLNAEIDNLGIEVDRQKAISQLNYYLVSYDNNLEPDKKGN